MKKYTYLIVLVVTLSIVGCGGGGGGGSSSPSTSNNSDSNQSSSNDIHRGDIINIMNTSNIKSMGQNTLATKVKSLKVEHIAISEIGDSKVNYALEKGDISKDELTQLGEADANLDNNSSPIDLKNGNFYDITTTFTTEGTYPEGVHFTLSLVSTDKNNPFTQAIHNQNIIIDKEGEQSFDGKVLIPTDIPSGRYLLVSKLANDSLEKLVNGKKNINQIPSIGAIYVNIDSEELDRTTALLDINTTRYLDTPYKGKNIFFVKNFLNQASGEGRFLFSNIGVEDVNVSISATIELDSGKSLNVGILDPSDKEIKDSVILTIPHYTTEVADRIIKNKYNIVPIRPNFRFTHKKPKNQIVSSRTPELSNEIRDAMRIHHVFIPYAGRGVFGEERYRATLSYYLPKESYNKLISITPDLSRSAKVKPLKGKVKWHITFIDKETTNELIDSSIDISKFKDITVSPLVHGLTISHIPSLIEKVHPIDAALDMPDGTAYVFSGTECAVFNTKKGEVKGEWKKTSEVFPRVLWLDSNPITSAFRVGKIAYFFIGKRSKYFSYNLETHKVIKSADNRNFLPPSFFGMESGGSIIPDDATWYNPNKKIKMGECIDKYLKTDKFDATFIDFSEGKPNLYFIAKDKFLELEYIDNKINKYHCIGGSLGDREQWGSIKDKPITAVLSGHEGKGKFRFFINGFSSKVILNRPDLFMDKHKGLDKELGDSDIISLKFDANYGLEGRWMVPNVHGYAYAHLNFYLFGYKQSLFGAEAEAYGNTGKIHPMLDEASLKTKRGTRLYLSILGSTYVNEGAVEETTVTVKWNDNSTSQKERYYKLETLYGGKIASWKEKETIFESRFPVGPVLLAVSGGVEGDLEIKTPIVWDNDIENLHQAITLSPSAKAGVGVFADGGVDYDLVKAGVEANVRLTDIGVNGELKASLQATMEKIAFDINAKAGGEIDLIRAELSFYAGTRTHIKWCSSWGVPYPCGLGWDTWDIPVYHTPWLFNQNVTFFDKSLLHKEIPLN